MNKSSLFILAILTLSLVICQYQSVSLKVASKNTFKLNNQLRQSSESGLIVDGLGKITSIKVNCVELGIQELANKDVAGVIDAFTYPFRQGDRIDITVENTDSEAKKGLAAEVYYKSIQGGVALSATDNSWKCGTAAAQDLGGFADLGQEVDYNFRAGHLIWAADNSSKVTCTIKLGKPVVSGNYNPTLKKDEFVPEVIKEPVVPIVDPVVLPVVDPVNPIVDPLVDPTIVDPVVPPVVDPIKPTVDPLIVVPVDDEC